MNFFQASLRNCINCIHCDDHFFIFKTVNIGAMTSIILERDVHAERNADQHFDMKINARQVGPHFGSNSPMYGKMPGVCLGRLKKGYFFQALDR